MYLSQTPNHYLAVRCGGMFFSVAKRNRIGENGPTAIESKAQQGFRKLGRILGEIQDVVKGSGTSGRISIVCTHSLFSDRGGRGGRVENRTCVCAVYILQLLRFLSSAYRMGMSVLFAIRIKLGYLPMMNSSRMFPERVSS